MAKRSHPDRDLIALGIQQPWAELILRGLKTIEVRSQSTRVRGQIYLYASRQVSALPVAHELAARHRIDPAALPTGKLVGTVEIADSRPCEPHDATAAGLPVELLTGLQGWQLVNPERLALPLEVRFLPYGVWFYPFRRKNRNAGSETKSRR